MNFGIFGALEMDETKAKEVSEEIITHLEIIEESKLLDEKEVEEKQKTTQLLWKLSKEKETLLKQKSRIVWLKEGEWKEEHIKAMLESLSNLCLEENINDCLIWKKGVDGQFSVKQVCGKKIEISRETYDCSWYQYVWRREITPNMHVFLWLAVQKAIALKDFLFKRKIVPDTSWLGYIWCDYELESVDHLL